MHAHLFQGACFHDTACSLFGAHYTASAALLLPHYNVVALLLLPPLCVCIQHQQPPDL